jgi:adenine phosphoribosyltransferase
MSPFNVAFRSAKVAAYFRGANGDTSGVSLAIPSPVAVWKHMGYDRHPIVVVTLRVARSVAMRSEHAMSAADVIDLKQYIRDVPDFPKPGILFKDITPLLSHPRAFQSAIDRLTQAFSGRGVETIAAAEARGFLFGAPLALALGVAFVPIRKPGKLPYATISQEYQLEYGTDRLEVHNDAIEPGRRVVLIDDVLATGGTMRACRDLVVGIGAEVVACAFVVELGFLNGREKLDSCEILSLVTY